MCVSYHLEGRKNESITFTIILQPNCNLEKIIIPDNIVEIQERAFTNNRLKKVILSNNLEIIESNTFKNNKIEEIIIPEKVKEIKDEAFKNNRLKKLLYHTTKDCLKNLQFIIKSMFCTFTF